MKRAIILLLVFLLGIVLVVAAFEGQVGSVLAVIFVPDSIVINPATNPTTTTNTISAVNQQFGWGGAASSSG